MMEEKIKRIKALALDVDGVMTEGKIIVNSDGTDTKHFDVHDGYGLVVLKRAGFKTAIITARAAKPVEVRGQDLKIDRIYQDAYPKVGFYEQMLKDLNVAEEEVCFMGDDLPDLPILKRVGFAVAVANATDEIKKHADYITQKRGGRGAVREVIELILKTQGKWEAIIQSY